MSDKSNHEVDKFEGKRNKDKEKDVIVIRHNK